jgi:phosphatidylserine/phosphatidylglycerophosphate/cardiolipin synthase-like enzyme
MSGGKTALTAASLFAIVLLGCGGAAAGSDTASTPPPPEVPPAAPDDFVLVETWPSETTLDHRDLADAAGVWVEMIGEARERIDFVEFYGVTEPGGRLEPVIAALEEAVARGVRVRFVFDRGFSARMPEVPERLAAIDGIEVRTLDFGSVAGGVEHAKLFVVDDREAYVGSQNFDWRSLEHIQELGVRVGEPRLVAAVRALFDLDWALAGGASVDEARGDVSIAGPWPVEAHFMGEAVRVTPVASPTGALPDEALWEWPMLRDAIGAARERVRIQVMSYHLRGHGGDEWRDLDDALLAAARRGVEVELIVSHWDARPGRIEDLQRLQREPHVEVRIVTIPEASTGFIPFARTIHAKYATVDGHIGWIGSSNASGDYFVHSRNAGFFVEGRPFAARLDAFFDDVWRSTYAAPVDPERVYEAPRVAE